MLVAFHFERPFTFRLSNQSWDFFLNWMERTLISGYCYNFCVMVSDVTVVEQLSDLFVLNCLTSYGQGYNHIPWREI